MRLTNEDAVPEQFAQRLADLTDALAEVSRRLELVEGHQVESSPAQQTSLTIHSYDDDENSIQFLTENGFVIVRPWEANQATAPGTGAIRFRVQHPEGIEREVSVAISHELLQETAVRTQGRIHTASQFWICSAERRLANYLMEHDEFPPANEMTVETLDRDDVLLAIRWGKTG